MKNPRFLFSALAIGFSLFSFQVAAEGQSKALYRSNIRCVKEPSENGPMCGHDATFSVAKRHGFSDLSHAEMSTRIYNNKKLGREAEKAYRDCLRRNKFCS